MSGPTSRGTSAFLWRVFDSLPRSLISALAGDFLSRNFLGFCFLRCGSLLI